MTLAANMLTVATSLTDSLLFRWLLLLAVVCALITLALAAIRRILRWADAEVERAVREALAIEADDWDEPTRVQVESDTPIYTDLRREQFVADAMAEIEELTGGVA